LDLKYNTQLDGFRWSVELPRTKGTFKHLKIPKLLEDFRDAVLKRLNSSYPDYRISDGVLLISLSQPHRGEQGANPQNLN
jgi:hypothetical protein